MTRNWARHPRSPDRPRLSLPQLWRRTQAELLIWRTISTDWRGSPMEQYLRLPLFDSQVTKFWLGPCGAGVTAVADAAAGAADPARADEMEIAMENTRKAGSSSLIRIESAP